MRQMEVEMKKYIKSAIIVFYRIKEFYVDFIGKIIYFPVKFMILFFIWYYVYSNIVSNLTYSFEEMIGYYFILAIVEVAIMPCGIVTYEEWKTINTGELNMFLTKPISYPMYCYFQKLAEFLLNALFGYLFLYITKVIMKIFFNYNIKFENSGIFFVALFLGFSIMVNLFQIVGHITFWVENVLSLRDNVWNIIKIFSGEIFPIALYPPLLRNVCRVLPFEYIYYTPISILQGKILEGDLLRSICIQLGWSFILFVVNGVIWRKGNRRYVSQGG